MNYNFTDRVRKVLAMAREEAIRLQHDYVGTEHILLGLIREGEGVAAAVLMNLNVDLEQIHERVEESVRKGKATIALGELPYTNQVEQFGKVLGIDRPDIINDDLGAFTGAAAELSRGAGDALNEVFWTQWLDDAAFFPTVSTQVTSSPGSMIASTTPGRPPPLPTSSRRLPAGSPSWRCSGATTARQSARWCVSHWAGSRIAVRL